MSKVKKRREWCDIRGKIHDRDIANRHPDLVARIEALKANGWKVRDIMIGGLSLSKNRIKFRCNDNFLVAFVVQSAERYESNELKEKEAV